LPQIRQNRFQRGPVAVDVGDDGDTHRGQSVGYWIPDGLATGTAVES
jgi:hypothetical protein